MLVIRLLALCHTGEYTSGVVAIVGFVTTDSRSVELYASHAKNHTSNDGRRSDTGVF
jgi:hypothetical protein